MDEMTETPELCDKAPEGWQCTLEPNHLGPCPAEPITGATPLTDAELAGDIQPKRTRSGNALLLVLVVLTLAVGLGLTALQLNARAKDAAQDKSDRIVACRGDFNVKLVATPNAQVGALRSNLTQIQAAGLEATTDDEGTSGIDSRAASPYDGMTLEELRPLSTKARADLSLAQAEADLQLEQYRKLSKLAKNDQEAFLTACKEQLT